MARTKQILNRRKFNKKLVSVRYIKVRNSLVDTKERWIRKYVTWELRNEVNHPVYRFREWSKEFTNWCQMNYPEEDMENVVEALDLVLDKVKHV